MNLMQRILEVRKAVGYVQKDKAVSTGNSSYKAVTHDQVTAHIRSALNQHGIVIIPNLQRSQISETRNKDGVVTNVIRYEATYAFTFMNAEDPADRFDVVIEAHANDNGDKAPGKALSYAKKYALLKVFELETGEDEESRVPDLPEYSADEDLKKIESCTTEAELKKVFTESIVKAQQAKNKHEFDRLKEAKDKKKKEIGVQ